MTREGLRSQTGKEDDIPLAQMSPNPSDSEAEEQPTNKQIMTLMAQMQSQMVQIQNQLQAIISIPSIRDALGGEKTNSHADTNLVSSSVEEHIPLDRPTQADSNTEPATLLAVPHSEPATSAPTSVSSTEPKSSSTTIDEKFRKWINKISFLSYGEVQYKSAVDLYKRLDRLGNEFVRHTGKLATNDVLTLGLVTLESDKNFVAMKLRGVLSLKINTDEILALKIDTLKQRLRKAFPALDINDLIEFAKTLPGNLRFPQQGPDNLQIPILERIEYSDFHTGWEDICSSDLVKIIVGKFKPPVRQLIEAKLSSVDDRDRLGTIFDIIMEICGETHQLGEIFIMEFNQAGPASSSSTRLQSQSGNAVTPKKFSKRNRSGRNDDRTPKSQPATQKFTCFKCGGGHHTKACTVTSPTSEQTKAGIAAKEAYTLAKAKKDTNPTGITSETK